MEPSIKLEHADARGEIYSISLPDNRELMLLHSNAGVFRGGHSHDCNELVVLLSGKMRYHKVTSTDPAWVTDKMDLMDAGDVSRNLAGEIHMAAFLEDSWVVEFKFAGKDSWTQTDYEPYRARVRESARTQN